MFEYQPVSFNPNIVRLERWDHWVHYGTPQKSFNPNIVRLERGYMGADEEKKRGFNPNIVRLEHSINPISNPRTPEVSILI